MMDPRPFIFFRSSFSCLMLVYSAGRCTDFAFAIQDSSSFSEYSNILNEPFAIPVSRCLFPLNFMHLALAGYPWLSPELSAMYWRGLHCPMLLLCSLGMLLSSGVTSRLFYASFAWLKIASVFRSLIAYNNHEYLYAILALLFSLLGNHDEIYGVASSLNTIAARGSWREKVICTFGVVGLFYMMTKNAFHGIASEVAPIGMAAVWAMNAALLQRAGTQPSSPSIPVWNMWVTQAILCSVYLYAFLAKLDIDWLSGRTPRELLKNWTAEASKIWLSASMKDQDPDLLHSRQWESTLIFVIIYGGLIVDFAAAVLLPLATKSRRVLGLRIILLVVTVLFHLSNHFLFVIETFPWVMISSAVLFLPNSWADRKSQVVPPIKGPKSRSRSRSGRSSAVYKITGLATSAKIERRVDSNPICESFVRTPFLSSLPNASYSFFVAAVISVLLYLSLALPFTCGFHSVAGEGDTNWYSTCQFFVWHMMTRSVNVRSLTLRLTHPMTAQTDHLSFSSLGMATQNIRCSAFFEDLLLDSVQKISTLAIPTTTTKSEISEFSKPMIFADVWLEINGPPTQRYIQPNTNLALASLDIKPQLFGRPTALASWVLPRIKTFRSDKWRSQIDVVRHYILTNWRLQSHTCSSAKQCTYNDKSDKILFIADSEESKIINHMIFSAAIVAEPMVYGMVLYGTAFVKGYGLLSAGECFTASSRLSWAVTSDAATATKNTVDHNRKSVDGIALLVLDVRDFENAEFYDPTIIESEGVNQWINEIKNHRDTNLTFKSSDSFQNNKCELPF